MGGGVLLAVKKCLRSEIILTSNENVEDLFVLVRGTKSVLFGAAYMPPLLGVEYFESHCSNFEHAMVSVKPDYVVIAGDYNLGNCVWVNDDLGVGLSGVNDLRAQALVDTFGFYGLHQANAMENVHGRVLDLVFTQQHDTVVDCAVDVLSKLDAHHPALSFTCKFFSNVYNEYEITAYDFRNSDFDSLNVYFSSIDWVNSLPVDASVDVLVDTLYNCIYEAIYVFVPKRRLKRTKFPVWYSHDLRQLVLEKKKFHKKFKISKSWDDYLVFCNLRAQCKSLASSCYASYVDRVEGHIKNNVKAFWNFVNGKRRDNDIPSEVMYGERWLNSDRDIANGFANHFQSVFAAASYSPSGMTEGDSTSGCDVGGILKLELTEVLQKLNSLDINKGPGPDQIPTIFFTQMFFIPGFTSSNCLQQIP
ncbi:uncharacterized protein LOC123306895 [Coccinella septempunctata]|uniref:uncharacterized protein LOC123306895 n=1 Tax=Coccinella septempunctata TaxID=41139 RepID=UPI001D05D6AA|nr:uncharacterized protein LOC123306895 [Coccinella septempunctata]